MAKCKVCKKEMSSADSCESNKFIEFSDGKKLPSIKYKAPTIKELEKSLKSFENPNFPESLRKKMTANIQANINLMKKNPGSASRCHDCGVKDRGYHHPGCDSEICPKCKGQLLTCGCLDK